MRIFLFLIIIITTYGCNKPKTVFICGDHVCVNKSEAEQYFEDNLTLEVKIINKKGDESIDLVELNLNSSSEGKREITFSNKDETSKEIKVLSNDEIVKKKSELKIREKNKKKKLKDKKVSKQASLKVNKNKKKIQDNSKEINKIVNKPSKKITDICTILEKCSIDEISKYLVNQGKKRKFPDISTRENK